MKHVCIRKSSAVAALLALLLSVLLCPAFTVSADTLSDKRQELADLQAEWKELEKSIAALSGEIADQKTKVDQLYKQVSNLEAQIKAYEEQIALVDQQITDQQTDIDRMNMDIASKEAELKRIFEQLKKRIKAITKTGNYSSLQMLFDTDEYADFLLKSQVLKVVTAHDHALQQQVEEEKQALDVQRVALEAALADAEKAKAELDTLKAELDDRMAALETLYTTAYKEKVALEKQQGIYEDQQESIKKAEAALQQEIEKLVSGSTNTSYGGKMYWPVPAVNRISCTYGQKKTYFHWGTDIWGPGILKKPIVAAADGEVLKAKWNDSWGWYVLLDHGYDDKGVRIMTLYAHMYQRPDVKVGQMVIGGQTRLGIVGNTGNSEGAHLHFEVYEDGYRVDALKKGYIAVPK